MEFEKLENEKLKIKNHEFVNVKECGNVFEVKYIEHINDKCFIKKISDTQYINLKTGEICDFKLSENRSQSFRSLKNSMENLRSIINTNCVNIENIRWVTITYTENMTDTKKLYEDMKKLIKKVRYKFGHFEYINVAEPQGRGAWHMHCLWIFDKKAPYISQKWLTECWGHGNNVKVKKIISDCDNLGSYLTAYLCDVKADEATIDDYKYCNDIVEKEIDENGEKILKKFLKGARLHFYPPKFNLFRCSRGIEQCIKSREKYSDIMKKIGSLQPTFKKGIKLIDDDTGFENTIITEYYNTKRK